MKLPSITTSSVVTGISGKSVYSDGYRHKDSWDKKSSLLVGELFESRYGKAGLNACSCSPHTLIRDVTFGFFGIFHLASSKRKSSFG
ncbi:hypothetical protein DPMN_105865 [Dreissena polymorpha]|uniref:Uncharacterized protein n=1 Tax=Dreissena polymorpha TaxID=45954 RepID=A0A9D4QHV0_DREPO|nr:hypothetical protein DPMN_105865 [Dreissena polymorpha]